MAPNVSIGFTAGVSVGALVIAIVFFTITGISSAESEDFDKSDFDKTAQSNTTEKLRDETSRSVGTGGYGICLVGADSPCNGDDWDDSSVVGHEREPEPTENTSTVDWDRELDAEDEANNSVSS